jgi:hypothetical protein
VGSAARAQVAIQPSGHGHGLQLRGKDSPERLILSTMGSMTVIQRPPRTAAHATRDALLVQFRDAGLVPVVSTNGSVPDADVQVVKGTKPGEVTECWLTTRGQGRLYYARNAYGVGMAELNG